MRVVGKPGRACVAFVAFVVFGGALTAPVVTAGAADKSAACGVVSASTVGSIFGASMKTVTPLDPDRATDVPGGIVTSCTWKAGSKTVSVALSGAGKGGASIWNARTLYDAETGAGSGTLEPEHIAHADAAALRAAAGDDRLTVLAGEYVVDAESTLGSKAGAGEAALVELVKAVLPKLKPALFTKSTATPNVSSAATLLGTTKRDVTYCTVDGTALKLDLYYPTKATTAGGLPVVLYVHGGQLISGTKNAPAGSLAGALLPAATARGYAFVSIDYRLAPANKWPAQIEDSKCAIRYLRANATTLGIDADRIGIIGSSSGGTLVSLMGVTDAGAGMEGRGGYDGVSSRVCAVVDEFGANLDLRVPAFSQAETVSRLQAYVQPPTPDLVRSATVVNHVTPDDPPFLIVHGDHDPYVNLQQSRDLDAKLRSVGVPSTLLVVANGGHGWTPDASTFGPITPTWDQIVQTEMVFFDKYLKA
jgi:acetyl esterase/lipase